ncbi:MAG: hypothetical protein JXX28_02525 [Deltaproteobacteria bacterium]|nr:hypothetical protein [Deltaproteobacteria bacterium]
MHGIRQDEVMSKVRSTGLFKTVRQTPGWVWIVIGGVVLLIVGVVAASAVHHRREHEE